MKKTIVYTLITAMAAVFAVGCSPYSKLLKTDDYAQQYRVALEYMETGKYQKALTLLEKVRMHYLNSDKADSVMFYTGMGFYKMGDFETSGMAFDEFRKTHSRSPFLEEAEYMYAKGFYYSSPDPDRDQSATFQAMQAIDEYLERYPNSSKKDALEENMVELRQKIYDKVYINARTYYKIGRYKSAIVALRNALTDYPESNHREEILYMMTKSSYEYAHNSRPDLKRDRYLDMMDHYLTYISEYPEGQYGKELGKLQNTAKNYLARFGDGGTVEVEIEE